MSPPSNMLLDDEVNDAEYDQIVAAIADTTKKIEKYEDGLGPRIRPYRYVVDMTLPPITSPGLNGQARFPLTTASFVTKQNTIFFAKRIEFVYSVVGTTTGGQPATLPVPASARLAFMRFLWSVRDTGSDREWMNAPLPDSVLCTGNTNGFVLRRGHFALSGASEAVVTVDASQQSAFPIVGLTAVTANLFQFSFVGVEVLL